MSSPVADGDLQARPEVDRALAALYKPGGPQLLVIAGEPGIGKSTAWGVGVEQAWRRELTVLSCRGAESEVSLAFCGLADLFEDRLGDLRSALPPALLDALTAATLRGEPTAEHTEREVGLAVTAALRELASRGPLLLAIDDAQWVDRATVEMLSFAVRRLGSTGIRMLVAARLPDDGGLPQPVELLRTAVGGDRSLVVTLTGFPPLTLARIVRARLGLELTPRQIHHLSGWVAGNPFWALELAATTAGPQSFPVQLPLPSSRTELLERRVSGLTGDVRTALAVVAALTRPSVDKAVAAMIGFVGDPEAAVDAAVEARVLVESAGMLRPAHPLLGSAALQMIPPIRRRRLHRRFSELATDPEEYARHLVLAGNGEPDQVLATALDAGIEHARRRGAVHAAADLADRAVTWTPPAEQAELARRRLVAAALNFSIGDLGAACRYAEDAWRQREHCQDWAQMLALLVELTYWVRGQQAATAIVAQVLAMYPNDHPRRLLALALASDVGDGAGTPRAELATQAISLADRLPDPDPWAVQTALLYLVSAKLDAGQGIDLESMDRARSAEAELQRRRPHWTPVINRVDTHLAYFLKIVDDLSGARSALDRCITLATTEGDDGSLAALFGHLALTHCWAGDYPAALAASAKGAERAGFGGGVVPVVLPAARALTLLHTGNLAAARDIVAEQLPDPDHPANSVKGVVLLHIAGLAELLDGRPRESVTLIQRALELAEGLGIVEPGRRQRLEGDLGSGLAALGRWDELDALAAAQIRLGRRRDRPLIFGVGKRLEALTLAGRRRSDDALDAAREAVVAHEKAGFPLDLARSQLTLARILRRRRARQDADSVQGSAISLLTAMGARGWLDPALGLSERRQSRDVLTKAERGVAELVGAGYTNREVAARLFVSVRTVEGHLALIYRKLGVRSRTELAHYPGIAGPVPEQRQRPRPQTSASRSGSAHRR